MEEDLYESDEDLARTDRFNDFAGFEEEYQNQTGENLQRDKATAGVLIMQGVAESGNENQDSLMENRENAESLLPIVTPRITRVTAGGRGAGERKQGGRGGGHSSGRGLGLARTPNNLGAINEEEKEEGTVGRSTAYFASGLSEFFPRGITNQREDSGGRTTPVTTNTGANRERELMESTEEIQFLGTRQTSGIAFPSGTSFQKASGLINSASGSVLKLLPDKIQPELTSLKTYTYIAELHFNKPLSEKGVIATGVKDYSVPICLGQWVKRAREATKESLILLPYRDETGGNPITNEDQIPKDDEEAIGQYYHNHRVENNGVLKGMIRFTSTVPWMELKNARSKFFKWMFNNKVYMRHTSFDADTIVLLGYLHGVHPDAARLTDLTKELKERMSLPQGTDFQVVPRMLGVLDSQTTQARYGFRAIAVETDSKMAVEVKEALFRLGDPKVEKYKWPITGKCLFIPMFRTASWTTEGIAAMAKLHSRTISQLEQIFIENIFDIDKLVVFREQGGAEQQRTIREAIQSATNIEGEDAVHSVHTSNRPGLIRVLVATRNAKQAHEFFGSFHEQLRLTLSPEDFYSITQGKHIQVTSRTFESNESKIYAGYAAALLRENPQDGQDFPVTSPQRKKSRMEISYSNMVKRKAPSKSEDRQMQPSSAEGNDSLDEESDDDDYGDSFWEKKIQAGFTKLFGEHKPLRADEMEERMKELIDKQAEESERKLDKKFASLTSDLQAITERENRKAKKHIGNMFDQQHQVLLNLTVSLQASLLQMHENVRDIAAQTNTRLTHQETPRIDVLQTSVVARSKEKQNSSSSDEDG